MFVCNYDTKKAKKLKIARDPQHDLEKMGWRDFTLSEPDENGIITVHAKTIAIDPFRLPKHIDLIEF